MSRLNLWGAELIWANLVHTAAAALLVRVSVLEHVHPGHMTVALLATPVQSCAGVLAPVGHSTWIQ